MLESTLIEVLDWQPLLINGLCGIEVTAHGYFPCFWKFESPDFCVGGNGSSLTVEQCRIPQITKLKAVMQAIQLEQVAFYSLAPLVERF